MSKSKKIVRKFMAPLPPFLFGTGGKNFPSKIDKQDRQQEARKHIRQQAIDLRKGKTPIPPRPEFVEEYFEELESE